MPAVALVEDEAPAAAIAGDEAPAVGAAAVPGAESGPLLAYQPGVALDRLLRQAVDRGASDLHVHSGAPLMLRLNGALRQAHPTPIPATEAERLIAGVLSDAEHRQLAEHQQVDFAHELKGVGRFRANAYRQQRGLDAVFRAIPARPPSLKSLGLPKSLARLADFHQGLVLLTGPAGCGKSSTMAALVNLLNKNRPDHILTIEDPIEYVFRSQRALVNQRQVGPHTESFARALRAALREDPDVIVIGELRDLETISLALTAAETGHLVLGTLHTSSAIRTINRLLGVFPPEQQAQIRTMVSESLRAIVSQRLVARADGRGRVPAIEVLINNKAVGNLIREKKTFQIRSVMQTGMGAGMCLLDASLAALVKSGTITVEEARRHAEEPDKLGAA
ncbi:MAG: type IV pilus twitching motility protein PilT [Acidobacteria bacterium]|nr:MAG: type IV pilus twitching motility protein PilT [Acidobacteriota bacterium]